MMDSDNEQKASREAAEKKPYSTPLLEEFGSLAELTRGGKPTGNADGGPVFAPNS